MLTKDQIEKLLEINGVSPSAPDQEIKSVLVSARWNQNDVETAIEILRENPVTHTKSVQSINNAFQSDDKLHPDTITSLLGISSYISADTPFSNGKNKHRHLTLGLLVQIIIVAIILFSIIAATVMWNSETGVFHEIGTFHSLR